MAIEYGLVLAGSTPIEQVAERAMSAPREHMTRHGPLLSEDLREQYGFDVTIRAGRSGYFDVEVDTGTWQWEPEAYVAVTFRMEKGAKSDWTVPNMLSVVRKVLDTGSEDAALIQNHDWLLLTRFSGRLTKHRRDRWWNHYANANEQLPG